MLNGSCLKSETNTVGDVPHANADADANANADADADACILE
jgi:hypothetical protein